MCLTGEKLKDRASPWKIHPLFWLMYIPPTKTGYCGDGCIKFMKGIKEQVMGYSSTIYLDEGDRSWKYMLGNFGLFNN